MKRRIKTTVNTSMDFPKYPAFTPKDLVKILEGLDQMQNENIVLRCNLDGTYDLLVGNSKYQIIDKSKTTI